MSKITRKTAYDYRGPVEGQPVCAECGSRHVPSYVHPEDRQTGTATKDGGYGYGFEYDTKRARTWLGAPAGLEALREVEGK